jgi:hypothetical protein
VDLSGRAGSPARGGESLPTGGRAAPWPAAPRRSAIGVATSTAVLLVVWASVVLPSGSVVGINVKVALFLAAVAMLVLDSIAHPHRSFGRLPHLAAASLMLFAVLGGFLVALVRGSTSLGFAVDALQGLVATIGVAFVIVIAASRGTVTWRAVLRSFLFGAFTYSVVKLALVAAIAVGVVTFAGVRAFFLDVFDYSFVSMLIIPGLVRAQFINDVTLPMALAILVLFREPHELRLRPSLRNVMTAVFLAAIVLAFSRWLFLLTAIVAALWFVLYALRRARTLALTLLVGLVGVVGAFVVLDGPALAQALLERFDSPAVEASDALRREQVAAMLDEIARNPLLGKGVGAYAPDAIQSVRQPYSYEVQWLAILLQLGVVGTTLLAVPLVALVGSALRAPDRRRALVVLAVTVLWLASGFTNPYLISSTSGVVFGVLAILPIAWRDIGSMRSVA